MATEQTIIPSAGNAPFPTQGGAGASPGFDALDFRRFWSRAYVEGVVDGAAWKVSESSTPGLTVDVAADVAPAFVQGDYVADQGLYYVPPHAGTVTLDVEPPDTTNPRVDRVVLEVLDDTHDGSGSTLARLRVVAGTPTASATQYNASGAASVPDNALHLANVLVPAGAASVLNTGVLDFRAFGLRDAAVGEVRSFASSLPDGWVEADGQALRRDQHARLFAEIGTTHGAGDGASTFNVPDLVDRVPLGASGTRPLGSKGGAATHTLTTPEMPAHGHATSESEHSHSVPLRTDIWAVTAISGAQITESKQVAAPGSGVGTGGSATGLSVQSNGGGTAHNNMQPYTALVFGVFAGSVAT